MHERLKKFAELVKQEYGDILKVEAVIMETRIRLYIKDDSFIDIGYPVDKDYFFHWQRRNKIIRINTAPDHPQIKTFPRHLHNGLEVKEDFITDLQLYSEDNLLRLLNFVRETLKEEDVLR